MTGRVHGDIRVAKELVPEHDLLCAGFPCQPFSKSGRQEGWDDKTRGTIFHEILEILRRRTPRYVILENVGNFHRHDGGRTWKVVRESLEELGYHVSATEHIGSGGTGLISPHHLGFPQHRERFFIVGSRNALPAGLLPKAKRDRQTSLKNLVQRVTEIDPKELAAVQLTARQNECIGLWNDLLAALPPGPLPHFPIWGDELDARYPFNNASPHRLAARKLRPFIDGRRLKRGMKKRHLMALLPSYAQAPSFPDWKRKFIRENRAWWKSVRPYIPPGWTTRLRSLPSSLRKLEWHCKGGKRNLWLYVLQFRPSGLRAKRYSSCPALVAMTSTQIPILGREKRFLTRIEGLRLQGFPDAFHLPASRDDAFCALGNAVHVGVVAEVARRLVGKAPPRPNDAALETSFLGAASQGDPWAGITSPATASASAPVLAAAPAVQTSPRRPQR